MLKANIIAKPLNLEEKGGKGENLGGKLREINNGRNNERKNGKTIARFSYDGQQRRPSSAGAVSDKSYI